MRHNLPEIRRGGYDAYRQTITILTNDLLGERFRFDRLV
jgi:hypothetical protein